ncbi:putative polygalacturonase [Vitis vinifera]|uniref:Putative polygalacturonase n=1 Tax=Vitis vinifera TaxID=29760 RepID=A0A438J5G6_VITVI|nr:putative polygalacturonase [Vitis vinifera]
MCRFVVWIFMCFAATALFLTRLVLAGDVTCSGIVPMRHRNDVISIKDFGGVGDGKTLNTKAFRAAIYRIEHLRRRGGTLLYIPPGVYLTESFNLTSHMTLYLSKDAVIRATQVRTLSQMSIQCLLGTPVALVRMVGTLVLNVKLHTVLKLHNLLVLMTFGLPALVSLPLTIDRLDVVLYVFKGISHSMKMKQHSPWVLALISFIHRLNFPSCLMFQDTGSWPLIAPLPSYGRGRELPGGRYMSFIHADGVHDVIITGENGTIDGQGEVWWNMWRQRTLQFTRPNLIELINSRNIIISNVIFRDSPFWNIHPVYCRNVVVQFVTILAPHDSPNTDGIDPDSSSNVCIEDSYISTGDDLVAVKSGWDEYGIAYGRSSSGITIRRITGSSPFAGIAVGSETSGGVQNVFAEHINLYNMGVGIHLKTNIGRGGVIRNITVSNVYMEKARTGIKIAGDVGDHPDDNFNPNALPVVKGVVIRDVWGLDVLQPGSIIGLKNSPFTGICLSKINLHGKIKPGTAPWKCSDVSGAAVGVSPWPCSELTSPGQTGSCSSFI